MKNSRAANVLFVMGITAAAGLTALKLAGAAFPWYWVFVAFFTPSAVLVGGLIVALVLAYTLNYSIRFITWVGKLFGV